MESITQTHLALLITDKNTYSPIGRLPIYAEISIVETKPPYIIKEEDFTVDIKMEMRILVLLQIPLIMSESEFIAMPTELKEKLKSK